MITKQQAAIIYSYDYLLVDKTNSEQWVINTVERNSFECRFKGIYKRIFWEEIGVKYFILARHIKDLNKNIPNCNGPQTCSLISFWNIAKSDTWEFKPRKLSLEIKTNYGYNAYNLAVGAISILPYNMFQDMCRMNFDINFPENTVKYF